MDAGGGLHKTVSITKVISVVNIRESVTEIYPILKGHLKNSYLCIMWQRNKNGFSDWGTLILMVLLFVLTISIPGKTSHTKHIPPHSPVTFEVSLKVVQAISAEAVRLPSAQNSCLELVAVPLYSLYCNMLKVTADDRLFSNQLTFLNHRSQRLRPLLLDRWSSYQCVSYSSEDPSILG